MFEVWLHVENLGKYLPLRCRVGDMGFVELQRTFEIARWNQVVAVQLRDAKIVRVFDCQIRDQVVDLEKIGAVEIFRRGDLFEEIYLRLERNVVGFE